MKPDFSRRGDRFELGLGAIAVLEEGAIGLWLLRAILLHRRYANAVEKKRERAD
jgi:hypothetical protein